MTDLDLRIKTQVLSGSHCKFDEIFDNSLQIRQLFSHCETVQQVRASLFELDFVSKKAQSLKDKPESPLD